METGHKACFTNTYYTSWYCGFFGRPDELVSWFSLSFKLTLKKHWKFSCSYMEALTLRALHYYFCLLFMLAIYIVILSVDK